MLLMADRTSSVARSAKVLSRNPLGLLALCLVVGDAIAGAFLLQGRDLPRPESVLLCVFVVTYPLVVVWAIYRLISRHHTQLYAPADFRDERCFLEVLQLAAPGTPQPEVHTTTIAGDDFQLLIPAPAANSAPRREPGFYVHAGEAYYVTRRQHCFHLSGDNGTRRLIGVSRIPNECCRIARRHCDGELRALGDAADNLGTG